MTRGDTAALVLVAAALVLLLLVSIDSLRKPEPTPSAPVPADDASPPDLKPRALTWQGLSLREAMHWRPLEGKRVACLLCPRRCDLKDGERGVCRARVNLEGTLYTLVYGKPVAMHTDPIEKKPLYNFLPGARAYSIATAGCNLGCVFCQNWQISQAAPERAAYANVSPHRVVQRAKEQNCTTIAFTYTEPTIFYEYMLDTAKAAREEGLKTLLITCGYIQPEPLRELCQVIDAANIDLKGYSKAFYRDYCKAELAPVLEAIKIAKAKGVWVEITNLLIPGANDDPKMIRDMCRWIKANCGVDTPLHFSAFHPAYRLRDRSRTPAATLVRARKIALEEGLRYVYIGNVHSEDGSTTFCPKCRRAVIVRRGFYVSSNDVVDGKCRHCGQEIAGVWPVRKEVSF